MIGIDTVVVLGCIMFVLTLWYYDCKNRELRKLLKQKEAEIKQLKRNMRDRD